MSQATTFASLSIVFFSVFLVKPLKSQEPSSSSSAEHATITILQEAEALTRELAKESQAAVLVKVASEYERRGRTSEADKLWSELNELLKQSDSALRQDLLMMFAIERTRAGNFDKAKAVVAQIEDAVAKQKAIQATALVLSEQSRFEDAVIYAESLPRSSEALFVTMEMIGLAAAKNGDTKSAFRASRGMNPGQGGSMARKLKAVSRMCNSFWKTGNKEDAISFIKQGKRFSDLMRLDLETTMVVDTTLASLQSEDLESDLKKLIHRVAESKENADQDVARLAMAGVLLSFDRDELIPHLKGGDKNYQTDLEMLTIGHIVNSGDAGELKQLDTHRNPMEFVMGLTRIANTRIAEKKIGEAKSYLDQAEQILQSYLKNDSRPINFLHAFSDFSAAESSVGQHARALAMVRQYPDSAMVPQLMVRVAASMR